MVWIVGGALSLVAGLSGVGLGWLIGRKVSPGGRGVPLLVALAAGCLALVTGLAITGGVGLMRGDLSGGSPSSPPDGCLGLVSGSLAPEDASLLTAIYGGYDAATQRATWISEPTPGSRNRLDAVVQSRTLYSEQGEQRAFAVMVSVPSGEDPRAVPYQDAVLGVASLSKRADGWCLQSAERSLFLARISAPPTVESIDIGHGRTAFQIHTSYELTAEEGRAVFVRPGEHETTVLLDVPTIEWPAGEDGDARPRQDLVFSTEPGPTSDTTTLVGRVMSDTDGDPQTPGVVVEERRYALGPTGYALTDTRKVGDGPWNGSDVEIPDSPGLKLVYGDYQFHPPTFNGYRLCANGKALGTPDDGAFGANLKVGRWRRDGGAVEIHWEVELTGHGVGEPLPVPEDEEEPPAPLTEHYALTIDRPPRAPVERFDLAGRPEVFVLASAEPYEGDCRDPVDLGESPPGAWPAASTRPLTEQDLAEKSADQLAIMRTEIYARRGVPFETDPWKTWASAQPWYEQFLFSRDEVEPLLTDVERANVALIEGAEARAQASRGEEASP